MIETIQHTDAAIYAEFETLMSCVENTIERGEAFETLNGEGVKLIHQFGNDIPYTFNNLYRQLLDKLADAAKAEGVEKYAKGVNPHASETVEVGTVFSASWGYDQTNVDFFVVVRCTAKTAWILPMDSKNVTSD